MSRNYRGISRALFILKGRPPHPSGRSRPSILTGRQSRATDRGIKVILHAVLTDPSRGRQMWRLVVAIR